MPSTPSTADYQRRVIAIAAIPVLLLFVIGAVIVTNRIEDDLERRVPAAIEDAGHNLDGATVTFSGQDGSMSCSTALDDPPAVEDIAYDVWGVRSFNLDRSCRTNTAADATGDTNTAATTTSTTEPPTATTQPNFDTVGEILTTDPQFSTLMRLVNGAGLDDDLTDASAGPYTVLAPTNAAFEDLEPAQLVALEADAELATDLLEHHLVAASITDLTERDQVEALDGASLTVSDTTVETATIETGPITARNGVVYGIDAVIVPADLVLESDAALGAIDVTLGPDGLALDGVIADESARAALVDTATATGVEVADGLIIDAATGVDADSATRIAALVTAMHESLVDGTVTFDAGALSVIGHYATDADRDAMQAAATGADATADLTPRPEASDDDAEQVESELNAIVAAAPILFDAGSATISDESTATLDTLARRIEQLSGIEVEVQGHTDSDGSATENQALSQRRAEAVLDALVDRGVPTDQLTATGFGANEPIIVDGNEDKAASRRVVFDVTVTAG